ncbi:hypothetical protein Pmani_001196 [Petrolisthes manimaculis]|uniref:Uncharacterized protein n=1 Tax=Petrolisthes manimaculis TaxID=1843537 RepID=A0AAE1QL11_9EUCA|nr:hypothetical protein Pmani_001196 [Petrolisthes manimaculis]
MPTLATSTHAYPCYFHPHSPLPPPPTPPCQPVLNTIIIDTPHGSQPEVALHQNLSKSSQQQGIGGEPGRSWESGLGRVLETACFGSGFIEGLINVAPVNPGCDEWRGVGGRQGV